MLILIILQIKINKSDFFLLKNKLLCDMAVVNTDADISLIGTKRENNSS